MSIFTIVVGSIHTLVIIAATIFSMYALISGAIVDNIEAKYLYSKYATNLARKIYAPVDFFGKIISPLYAMMCATYTGIVFFVISALAILDPSVMAHAASGLLIIAPAYAAIPAVAVFVIVQIKKYVVRRFHRNLKEESINQFNNTGIV